MLANRESRVFFVSDISGPLSFSLRAVQSLLFCFEFYFTVLVKVPFKTLLYETFGEKIREKPPDCSNVRRGYQIRQPSSARF